MKSSMQTPRPAQRIAYLDAADLGATLALHREPDLAAQPLALLDARGQVLAVNHRAGAAGIVVGQSEHQAVSRAPRLVTRPADRYPIWETQAELLARVARYAGRWQPAGLGAAYRSGSPAAAPASTFIAARSTGAAVTVEPVVRPESEIDGETSLPHTCQPGRASKSGVHGRAKSSR